MTTEQKIKEAFEAWWADSGQKMIPDEMEYGLAMIVKESCFVAQRAGYLALLNSLELIGTITENGRSRVAYKLPEGVTKP